jgi:hypothetical protein
MVWALEEDPENRFSPPESHQTIFKGETRWTPMNTDKLPSEKILEPNRNISVHLCSSVVKKIGGAFHIRFVLEAFGRSDINFSYVWFSQCTLFRLQ